MTDSRQLLSDIVTQIIHSHDYRNLLDLHLYLDGIPPESDDSFFHVFTRQLAEKYPQAFTEDYGSDIDYSGAV